MMEPLHVAYCGPAPAPVELLQRWNLDPLLICAIILSVFFARYYFGDRLQARPLAAAVATLSVIFISPLCALSSALFSVRVLHHVLLVAVAAPLLALSLPRMRMAGSTIPLAIATLMLWLWHAPALYTAALEHAGLYWLMQLSLLLPAIWFWRAVLAQCAPPISSVIMIGAAAAQMGLLGAILTFAPVPLYSHHRIAPLAWGLSPLQDQQLAGLIMWVPAMLPYAAMATWLAMNRWRRGSDPVAAQ